MPEIQTTRRWRFDHNLVDVERLRKQGMLGRRILRIYYTTREIVIIWI
jgi:hypothetical protein